MSLNIVRNGSLNAVASLPAGAHVGELLTVVNLGSAAAALADSATLELQGGAVSLATADSLQLVWDGVKWIEVSRRVALEDLRIVATVGDLDTGTFEIGIAIQDARGNVVVPATPVVVRSTAETDDEGGITVDVGTAVKEIDAATGTKSAWITPDDEATETDAVVVTIANAEEELTVIEISADGCRPVVLQLDFTPPAP